MTLGEFLNLMDKLNITVESMPIRHVADYFELGDGIKYAKPIYYHKIEENLDDYEYLYCWFYEDERDPSIYCKKTI